jgi:transcriptional regulator with XRE-family HTH domain
MKREQLSDFLRTRRARLKPADVGLVVGGTRRTPGLRREEVALLAGVGISWYTWLEQGRDINVSSSVLDAIGTALQLSQSERAHLYSLSGLNPPPAGEHATEATPELLHLLEAWSPRPAMLQDRYWNLLAVNEATQRVFGYGATDRNCLVTFFTNGRYRGMYQHWAAAAPGVVSAFRADAARYPDDARFAEIVDDLGAVSPEFVELWERHDVGHHSQAIKAVLHPQTGEVVFDKTTLAVTDHPGWHLVLYNPRPGTGTDERLAAVMRAQSRNGPVSSASSSR